MIKPDLGTKRICPSCAARFYDLQRRPIECPKCNYTFEPEMLLKQRRARVPEPPAPKPVVEVIVEDETRCESEEEDLEEHLPEWVRVFRRLEREAEELYPDGRVVIHLPTGRRRTKSKGRQRSTL